MNEVGITKINGRTIHIHGTKPMRDGICKLSEFGIITFSRQVKFKSTDYMIYFFKPTHEMRSMYNLGNELLVVSTPNGMNDFKSRTKDFVDYMLVTNQEFKNRLDKVTCFILDEDESIVKKIKEDRIENPDGRLIVPFCLSELNTTFNEYVFGNRLREFLYEKDLFGIAVPLKNDILFFGKDRTKIISELYGRYKQGEEGGLFGLRRIGKTSILNLLKLRIVESDGVAVYFDCSGSHHFRWHEFLRNIIKTIIDEYSVEKNENGNVVLNMNFDIDTSDERYNEKNAATSFKEDVGTLYDMLDKRRILLILDEIESIGYTTSPSKWWKEENDSLFFWQAIRMLIQMHNEYLSFVIAGVNPMCVEIQTINGYDNPIFGMLSPIYTSLFEYEDIKTMVASIGGRLGLSFDDAVYAKMMEDYGGHPFLIRQVCSKINSELSEKRVERPTTISISSYNLKCDEYRMGMSSVIEQILGVIQNYYPSEFELLKKLSLDGRTAFKKELALGEKEIQHLLGYCIIEKVESEFLIKIKSIEEYIKNKYLFDSILNEQKDKRARINMRRDSIEEKLRKLVFYSLKSKYGKKAKENLIKILGKTTPDSTQKNKMLNAPTLKAAIEELYLSQIPIIMNKDWKNYERIFPDKAKFQMYMEMLNRARSFGAHPKNVSEDDEVMFKFTFEFFEKLLDEY